MLKPIQLDNGIELWGLNLEASPEELFVCEQCLARDEQERASRFHFPRDRRRYIAGRGLMRRILSRYTRVEPAQLEFSYSPFGKPSLAGGARESGICFNLAHSDGVGLMAVARGREIGVDVERIRPEVARDSVAEQFFAPAEVAALRALPDSLQVRAFFNCWTRKEAFLEAHGHGLSLPLDQFEVTLVPGEPASLIATRFDPPAVSRWSLRDVAAPEGYVAALAFETKN